MKMSGRSVARRRYPWVMITPKRGKHRSIKTVSSGMERDARADVVHGVRNPGASVSRLIFISLPAERGGWRGGGGGRPRVNADLTRGTNKFDGTPIHRVCR